MDNSNSVSVCHHRSHSNSAGGCQGHLPLSVSTSVLTITKTTEKKLIFNMPRFVLHSVLDLVTGQMSLQYSSSLGIALSFCQNSSILAIWGSPVCGSVPVLKLNTSGVSYNIEVKIIIIYKVFKPYQLFFI